MGEGVASPFVILSWVSASDGLRKPTGTRDPDMTAAWDRFDAEAQKADGQSIMDLFATEPDRLSALTLEAAGLFLDLSKQSWGKALFEAALGLAKAADLDEARARLFGGEVVNQSEGRAVLHTALRAPDGADFKAKGVPVSAAVEAGRAAMAQFANGVRSGTVRGATGQPFTTIVHIGIGGSDLGPRLVWEALRPLSPQIDLRFVANVDGSDIAAALAGLDPAKTLVIAVSKTFTTEETMANALAARQWLAAAPCRPAVIRALAACASTPNNTPAPWMPTGRASPPTPPTFSAS